MIEDEETVPRPSPSGRDGDAELLLYDFFKYLTSLVLLTLGGVLIVMKDFDPEDVKPPMVIAAILVISASGVLSFSGSSEIVRSRYSGTPANRSLKIAQAGAPAILAFGIGLFLAMFIDGLVK